MMPKNKIGRHMMGKLKLFSGPVHEHQAQAPIPLAAIDGRPSAAGAIYAPKPTPPARKSRRKPETAAVAAAPATTFEPQLPPPVEAHEAQLPPPVEAHEAQLPPPVAEHQVAEAHEAPPVAEHQAPPGATRHRPPSEPISRLTRTNGPRTDDRSRGDRTRD